MCNKLAKRHAAIGKLSIADNGVGQPDGIFGQPKIGLGTGIIKALAQQLGAKVETLATPEGTTVSVTHATFPTKAVQAASIPKQLAQAQ